MHIIVILQWLPKELERIAQFQYFFILCLPPPPIQCWFISRYGFITWHWDMIRPTQCLIFKIQHCSGGRGLLFSFTGWFTKKAFEGMTEYIRSHFPLRSNYFWQWLFTFSEISEEEVISASHSFKTFFGSGIDNVSRFFIKTAAPILAKHLAYIFNYSLYMGQFPSSWKIARVSPTYKEGSPDERSNYRPISVLPVLSCLFEKLIYNQLCMFLDRHKFLYKHQSGFSSIHSVVTCLLSSTNEWYLNLDDKKYTGMVFIDLKRAFDTVDHAILAKKLYLYGVRNTES